MSRNDYRSFGDQPGSKPTTKKEAPAPKSALDRLTSWAPSFSWGGKSAPAKRQEPNPQEESLLGRKPGQ